MIFQHGEHILFDCTKVFVMLYSPPSRQYKVQPIGNSSRSLFSLRNPTKLDYFIEL